MFSLCLPRSVIGAVLVVTIALAGCSKSDVNGNNLVGFNPFANQEIGEGKEKFVVLGHHSFLGEVAAKRVRLAESAEAQRVLSSLAVDAKIEKMTKAQLKEDSLLLGFPITLLKEHFLFGGVITKVSEKQNETLGRLKLIDLTPIHVRPVVAKFDDGFGLAFLGCSEGCTEGSPEEVVLAIPVIGVDEAKGLVVVDLSPIGEGMNLAHIIDPAGEYTQLKPKSAKTVTFDFGLSTLLFDVEGIMTPLSGAPEPEVSFTTRWYLKSLAFFDPAFTSRGATPGVGYFMTERAQQSMVQRHSLAPSLNGGGSGMVKYYIKNVPTEHRAAFASAFDEWNEHFVTVAGRKVLAYEFVEKDDPRHALLVPGDVRFNILEWDLENLAPYGGLGPSIANQFTGEIFSSNTLVQGPTIMGLYTKWYQTGADATALFERGRVREADLLLKKVEKELQEEVANLSRVRFEVSLGRLKMRVPAQMESLHDPLIAKGEFEVVPAGVSFEQYMRGYFHDLVAHELGHNLGLRHNFRGNLGAAPVLAEGKVSHSIMEYLGRGFRYLDHIGPYDVMALSYGYKGVAPSKLDLFCTDEDVAAAPEFKGSAECSRDDATPDPFSFFGARVNRAVQLLVAPGQTEAPLWTVPEVNGQLTAAVTGVGLYVTGATEFGPSWTNFFTGGDRPATVDGVKPYVLSKVLKALCDPALQEAVAIKATEEAKAKTAANVQALKERVIAVLVGMKAFTGEELVCAAE